MQIKVIRLVNYGLGALAAFLMVGSAAVHILRPSEIEVVQAEEVKTTLPPFAFEQKAEDYEKIGESSMDLKYTAPTLQVPDLRNVLVYYGKNGRPDANLENAVVQLSFNGSKTLTSVPIGTKTYLGFDKSNPNGKYFFSPDNQETSLWIEVGPHGNDLAVFVTMKNENGEIINYPEKNARITLPEKEFIRVAGTNWEIGKFRVDGTILARQRVRWFGTDKFLEKHGGEDYADSIGRQRVDFGENEDTYSVYIKVGDSMIWKDNRWQVVTPNKESANYPLLVVKRVEERLMNLEIWDVGGKAKLALNVLKSSDTITAPVNIERDFKFVGARTKTQGVFEINNERMLLKPKDWLLFTENGWVKITKAEEIDDYVNRKLNGTLFVLDEIVKKEDGQILQGTVFNPTRTEMQTVELAMQPAASPKLEGMARREQQQRPGHEVEVPALANGRQDNSSSE